MKLTAKLDNRFPMSMPSQSGIFSGDSRRVRITTVGYRPTHTAMEVLVSDGGGATVAVLVEGEPAAERVVDGPQVKVGELLALGEKFLALVRYQPPVEIVGGFEAVQRGPFLLDALNGAKQFGAAKPGKLALRQTEDDPATPGTPSGSPA